MQSTDHNFSKNAVHAQGALWAAKALILGAGLTLLSSCSIDSFDARSQHVGSAGAATVAVPSAVR